MRSDTKPELLLSLNEPASGIAHLMSMDMAGQTYLSVRVFFYGEGGPDAVAREEPVWQAWLEQQFPVPVEA
jgi:hypothetical protein